jgi:uncharacterized membrane protein HdeD (DUF308 family)
MTVHSSAGVPEAAKEADVAHASPARGRSTGGLTAAVIILGIIAVVAIIAGVLYLTEPAKSLPAVLGTITHPASRANEHRALRGWVAIAFGVLCLAAAWFAARARGRDGGAPAQDRAR